MAGIAQSNLIDQPNELIAEYLVNERPQAVATVLFMVQPERAAAILGEMATERQAQVLDRMRRSRDLASHIRERLERSVAEGVCRRAETSRTRHLASILAALPGNPPAPEQTGPEEPEADFADTQPGPVVTRGILALVNNSAVSVGRLPMLEVALDRFVRLFQASLVDLCGMNAVLSLQDIRAMRLGDYLHGPDRKRRIFGVFRCVDWNHYGMLAADSATVGQIADLMLGDPDPPRLDLAGASTELERAAFAIFCEALLAGLGTALEPIAAGRFELDRLLDEPRFVTIDRPANTAIVVDFRLGQGAGFDLVLPCAALELVRARLSRPFEGEKFGDDPFWAKAMRDHLLKADARLRVVADGMTSKLADVAAWKRGSPVPLQDPIRAESGGVTVAVGRIGSRCNLRTLEVDRVTIAGEDETMTETLGGTMMCEAEPGPTRAVPKLDFAALGEVRMRISVVLGGVDMSVSDLLRIGRGAVLELDRRIGEQVDILVNDRPVAKGQIVIVENRIAVSVEELL